MSADTAEIQKLLQAGIEAAQRGDPARARALLLQVVQQDETNETGWLWLSEVVNDPVDQQTALENVLALNPNNLEAQARLAELRQKRGTTVHPLGPGELPASAPAAAPPVEDNWRKYLPEVPLEADDNIDDPYQCPYCGRPTGENDQRCSQCYKGLYVRLSLSDGVSEFLRFAQVMLGISLGLGLLGSVASLLSIVFKDSQGSKFIQDFFLAELIWGKFTQIPVAVAQTQIAANLARAGVWLGLIALLNLRWAISFYSALFLLIGDLFWSTYLLLSGYTGPVAAIALFLVSVSVIVLLFAADRDFPVHRVRVLTQPDPTVRSSLNFYKRGHYYRQRGMWALAVAQWRRAVGLAPSEAQYYKDLAVGYAKIKRFERSLRVLKEVINKLGEDPTITELMALVEAEAAKEKKPNQR